MQVCAPQVKGVSCHLSGSNIHSGYYIFVLDLKGFVCCESHNQSARTDT